MKLLVGDPVPVYRFNYDGELKKVAVGTADSITGHGQEAMVRVNVGGVAVQQPLGGCILAARVETLERIVRNLEKWCTLLDEPGVREKIKEILEEGE